MVEQRSIFFFVSHIHSCQPEVPLKSLQLAVHHEKAFQWRPRVHRNVLNHSCNKIHFSIIYLYCMLSVIVFQGKSYIYCKSSLLFSAKELLYLIHSWVHQIDRNRLQQQASIYYTIYNTHCTSQRVSKQITDRSTAFLYHKLSQTNLLTHIRPIQS